MSHPDPEHVLFISKWAQEIIATLVFVLLLAMKFIGKKLGGKDVDNVTHAELIKCSADVGGKIDNLEAKITIWMNETKNDITHVHERLDNHIDRRKSDK